MTNRIRRPQARGMTLVELLVVIAILGLIAGLGAMAFAGTPHQTPHGPMDDVHAARRQAIATGRAVLLQVHVNDAAHFVTALPDGSVLGDSVLAVDRMTGRPVHAAR
jgi:prepilin-type N-terminal cleavage/methylation domain-containing protein